MNLPYEKEAIKLANEIRGLLRDLERQGFDVERSKKSHYKVFKDGRLVATLPGTPSDRRSLRNCIAVLKKHGYRP